MSLLGRYRILEKLGAGGMGVVYRAVAVGVDGFEKPVVIKRIHQHLSDQPEMMARFVNEAKVAMRMSHGNVVQVLDLGKLEGEYFIALEWVEGCDLRSLLQRCRERREWLAPELSLFLITEVLRGLDYAHRRVDVTGKDLGIVHRDVSPANILCSFEGEVKLTDFGIARVLAWNELSEAGAIRGNLRFMSPEQAAGEEVDQRSDIFSVGSVLYLLLCKDYPFKAENPRALISRVQAGRYLPPAAHGVELPDEIETILLTAMAREIDDRYATAAAMLVALEDAQRSTHRATASDLRSFVQRLFEDRIRAERLPPLPDPHEPDRLVGTVVEAQVTEPLLDGPLPSYSMAGPAPLARPTRPSIPSALRRLEPIRSVPTVTAPPAPIGSLATAETTDEPARGTRSGTERLRPDRRLILLILVAVLLGAGAGYLLLRQRGRAVTTAARDAASVSVTRAPDRGPPPDGAPLALASRQDLAGQGAEARRLATRARAPAGAKRPGLRPRVAARAMGWVRISTRPAYADVYLAGKRLDSTPCRVRLPVGAQTLRLVNPRRGLSTTRTVTVHEERETALVVDPFE